jgi:hypothetical protein
MRIGNPHKSIQKEITTMKLRDAVEGYLLFKASRASPETIKTDTFLLEQFIAWRGDGEVGTVAG